MYTSDTGDHGELFWSGLVEMILTPMHILRPRILWHNASLVYDSSSLQVTPANLFGVKEIIQK